MEIQDGVEIQEKRKSKMAWKFKESGNPRWCGNSRKEEIQDGVEIQRKWKSKMVWKFKKRGNPR